MAWKPSSIHNGRPHQAISKLIQNVKTESSKWIKNEKLCSKAFAWQEGYGTFSYAKSQVDLIVYHNDLCHLIPVFSKKSRSVPTEHETDIT